MQENLAKTWNLRFVPHMKSSIARRKANYGTWTMDNGTSVHPSSLSLSLSLPLPL